ncbi:MAG: squalene--hopene cyclase, partial [Alphaproteobacteria bacterium]|nr:squalene--hopene cyclase [Alphaproteobacteria bacterium]
LAEPIMPKDSRAKAIDKAVAWVKERLNGEDGLGGIYPAMANAVMMFDCLGYLPSDPDYAIARKSVDKLVVDTPERTYCQPCLSPVWDTALSIHAMMEAGGSRKSIEKACDWLVQKQVVDVFGDWAVRCPNVQPGGWAFQYNNAYYPDLDDTAVIIMALDRFDRVKYRTVIERGVQWVFGLQSKNGGWGAFDADNTYYYLNCIPFADHGALLDPPSADVTARCISMLSQLGYSKTNAQIRAAINYLRAEQEKEGCWFGRWGTNYIYGTWSVLCALNAAGVDPKDQMVVRAVSWLKQKQRSDGGWGEDGSSYWKSQPKGSCAVSTPAQTSWALLGLMAAGEADSEAVKRGIAWLSVQQKPDGTWDEDYYTAVGFPRVFYLRYHGYKAFFPQWAMARYQNIQSGNAAPALYGM